MASAHVNKLTESIPSRPPDPAQMLMQMSTGHLVAAALRPVTKLGIADILADGPQPIRRLAQDTGANEDALYRVMRALASVGIFTEIAPRSFGLTPSANLLRSDVSGSRRDLVLWMTNEFHFEVWGHLMHSVVTGKPAVEKLYGKECFEVFKDMPEAATEFNDGMTNISALTIPVVLENYDFSGIKTLVDIAGGHGLLISQILKHYPDMKGIVFDLPEVIEGTKARIRRLALHSRLDAISGSFFESVPAGGDAYIMQHIIHDWDDERCVALLKNVHRALLGRAGGKLIILESLITAGNAPDPAKWLDLEMLLMPGGRERTEEEFRTLLRQGGFKLSRTISPGGTVSIIEAEPVY